MTSFLNFLKKHQVGLIVIAIIIVIIIVAIIAFNNILSNFGIGEEKNAYNPKRVEEIEKVGLKNDTLDKIVATLKENDKVKTVTYRVAGTTINFSVDVAKGTSKDEAKKLGAPILSSLSEDEKKVYSINLSISCQEEGEESEVYPIAAYKHLTSSDFVW